jgi:predicted ATP-grasp superfamily ATP-dependent carboligase
MALSRKGHNKSQEGDFMNIVSLIDRPPVVVAGAYQTGVVLMRNLVRRKVETCCIDSDASQQGFRTVYGKTFLCPNPDTKPREWEQFMIELAKRLGRKPVLIPTADQFVTAIADHSVALEPHFLFNPASVATQALLATKKRQYAIAGVNGMPVPKTKFVESIEEVCQFASEAKFPCLMKPVHFREWERVPNGHPLLNQKIILANSKREMESNYRLAESMTPAVVLQEIIEGPDEAKLVYLSCYGRGGKRLGHCLVRELRTAPIYFGSASVVEPIKDPETNALCDGFFKSIAYEGICELEVKRDGRDGQVKLIEANPRYSVTADAAPYAGVDLGWLHYLDLIGEPVEPVEWNGQHFHHIVLRRDVNCFRSYLGARLTTWGCIARSYRSAKYFDFDLHDWRLTAETCVYLLRILLYPGYRRLFPKRT